MIAIGIVAVAVLAWCAWSFTHPDRKCRWCAGRGSNPMSTSRRSGRCRRCGGSKTVYALDARILHALVRLATSRRSRHYR